ncbi:MAG: hypothetical protein L6R39_001071 [Caloplaca ligustica]|nr:MAG: hypothetical protein L6R39_001071 [Caloplaca ligustica]
MAVDIHGDTALHLHTGAIEEFQYLLRQKGSVVDCSQVDHTGDTIAERHARWYWARGPERSRLALEHENGQKRLLCGYGSIEPSLVPVTSKTLLLHETVAHLRYFYRNDHQDLQSGLTLIRQLLAEGVDIHCLCNHYSGYSKTPLAQIPRLTGEVDIGPKGLDEESKVTSLIIQAWLGLLRKANVDLDLYIREEEKLIRSKGIDLQWEYYEDNLEWEYCINWDFGTMTDDNPDRISVEYIFRPVSQESREPDKFLDKEAELDGIPGAWIEDS